MAALTQAELMYMVAREIGGGVLREGTCSSNGTTTTLIDTVDRVESFGYWINGTVWVGSGFTSVAKITGFNDQTSTLTFTPAVAAGNVESGDAYAVCKKRFPYYLLKQVVNQAVEHLGEVPLTNTSLTTAALQTEYQLPDSHITRELLSVHIQRNTDDSDDNRWEEVLGWYIKKGVSGTADYLVFRTQPVDGRSLMLTYTARHPSLDSADALNENVHPNRIIYRAALEAMKWYRDKTRLDDYKDKIRELERKADGAIMDWPINVPARTPKHLMRYL